MEEISIANTVNYGRQIKIFRDIPYAKKPKTNLDAVKLKFIWPTNFNKS